ncbi:uncharacterized protein LOC130053282 [Ostrea edulis]|uniref:uncharacterized protein LOC130053282 n=1 Tax=Ostrea edulis TaxID=37623 RepID=UPI0024AFCB63|nr:uncharacterized protein LOC130053282 [Ostrea edulis]
MSLKFLLFLWISCAILEIGNAIRWRGRSRRGGYKQSQDDDYDYSNKRNGSNADVEAIKEALVISSIVIGVVAVLTFIGGCALYWGYCNDEQRKKFFEVLACCQKVCSCCLKILKMGSDD